jgi:hypothetical protein
MPDKGNSAPDAGKPADQAAPISGELAGLPELKTVRVQISNEIVHLLSDQLYQSPLKAIEELVVNSYDAEALVCRLYVPGNDVNTNPCCNMMGIFDNGQGMTSSQMEDLWHIGNSKKRNAESTDLTARKQIGKFGIGKLATFTVGTQLTYVSKTSEGICTASLDFGLFHSGHHDSPEPIGIAIRKVEDWAALSASKHMSNLISKCSIPPAELAGPHWTLALIERLKPKASEITLGRLKWVLSTAMPLCSSFVLYLNGEEVKSSKDAYTDVARFKVSDLPKERLASLNEKTGDNFHKDGDLIRSNTLKLGVSGLIRVTERPLPGKSDDLLRSHGFFVRVRGRLINEDEPFFGMTRLHYGTESRLNAQIYADDLDDVITAPREGVGRSPIKERFEALLLEIFQHARQKYEEFEDEANKKESQKKEHERTFVNAGLVERPMATALSSRADTSGADADNTWFYTQVPPEDRLRGVVERLYTSPRSLFSYRYSGSGKGSRLVRFDPEASTFTINSDHPFAAAHMDDQRARLLLEDFVTAEALLETQLRAVGVAPQAIGEVLEERDKLLTSLAQDHPYSHSGIAQALIDASNDEHDLELALVAAARALGFVAKHLSGADEPDGIARYVAYPGRSVSIILEAKSSAGVPTLSAIDFGGLAEHRTDKNANGVLLVAPSYPGSTKPEDSAAANRAVEQRISCWRIADLARVVKAAESRHFNAETICNIVLNVFRPADVEAAIEKLFSSPAWDQQALASAIISALENMKDLLPDMDRKIGAVANAIATSGSFPGILEKDIVNASTDLSHSSQGALSFDGAVYQVFTSYDELRRRTAAVADAGVLPLRPGRFKLFPKAGE